MGLFSELKNVFCGDLILPTEEQITLERCIDCFTVIQADPNDIKLTEGTLEARLNLMIGYSQVLSKIPIGRIVQLKFLKSDDKGDMYHQVVRLKRTYDGFKVQFNNI